MTALALCIWRYPETENLTNAQIHQAINMLHLSLNANATVTCERIGGKETTGSVEGVHLRERFNHTIIMQG